ncbi:bifunctional DNA primase/polymerase [Streptomyces sp. NPDC050315]|uniref:bifunctional DNA primase/polymerase n=1 Tax=Streptomyces sp. NPDC050315 TaxID=3155039 RepID=UPI003440418F
MEAVAQWCATACWPVHPLSPGRKTPARNCPRCAMPGHSLKGCPCRAAGRWCHGFYSATTDPALIHTWWSQHPGFGVGVACGPAGLIVIDLDTHHEQLPDRSRLLPGIPVHDTVDLTGWTSGLHTLAVLAALRQAPDPATDEETLRVRTPSGGLHIWYREEEGRTWLCSTGTGKSRALGWQVDVRATGGYIIAPGTTTTDGTYTPLGSCRIPAPLPQWLAHELERTGHLEPSPQSSPAVPPATAPAPRARQAVIAAGGGRQPAARTLATVLEEVAGCATAPSGMGFSDKLNRAAYTAGGLVSAGHLTEDAAHQAVLAAADHARPHLHSRSDQIIRNGLRAGTQRPLYPGGRP